jgi:tetratricopeptide (TPR) repeat protein
MNRIFIFPILLACFWVVSSCNNQKDQSRLDAAERKQIAAELKGISNLSMDYPDSAIQLLRPYYQEAFNRDDKWLELQVRIAFGTAFSHTGATVLSLRYYITALQIMEQLPGLMPEDESLLKTVFVCGELGDLYFRVGDQDLSLAYTLRSIEALDTLERSRRDALTSSHHCRLLLSQASHLLLLKDYLGSEVRADKALAICGNDADGLSMAGLYNLKGELYKERGDFDQAWQYYSQAIQVHDTIEWEMGRAALLNNIGELKWAQSDKVSAIDYAMKALESSQRSKATNSYKTAAGLLSEIYSANGDYKKALDYVQKSQKLSDSVNLKSKNDELNRIAVQYRTELDTREAEYHSKLRVGNAESTMYKSMGLTIVLLLVVIILGLYIMNQRSRHQKLELKSKNMELEQELFKAEREALELQLRAHREVLREGQTGEQVRGEFIEGMASRLQSITEGIPRDMRLELMALISEMKLQGKRAAERSAEAFGTLEGKEFILRLMDRFPHLSPGEQKLAMYLRMGLNSKEISGLTFRTAESVKIARSRLRKKLGLAQSENLHSFLGRI